MISKLEEPFISLAQAQQVFFFQRKQSSHWKLVHKEPSSIHHPLFAFRPFSHLRKIQDFSLVCILGLFTLERNTKGKWSALKEHPKRKDVLHANT
jgi:hypothetical protein